MNAVLQLVEQVPIAAYVLRLERDEFVLQGVNAAARKRNPEILLLCGKSMAALYRDQPQVIEDARRCALDRIVVERELPVRRYDRTEATQFLRLTFVPVNDEYMVLFLQDVANPEVMQTALRESEARYQSLVASLPDAVLLLGTDGRVLYCNQYAVELLGANSQTELLGETSLLLQNTRVQMESGASIAPDELPCWHVLSTGLPEIGGVFAFVGPSGLRWVRIAAQPILSALGEVKGSISILTDVTERLQAQETVRDSAARLDLTLTEAKMGVWEFDPGIDKGWWSPNLCTVFRISSDSNDLAGFLKHVHPEDRDAALAKLRLMTGGQHGDEFTHECRIVGEDKLTRWARIRGRMSCDASQRKLLRGTVTDTTTQRTLEEELRRASRLESIGRLAGGVAHDFNNLLAAMLGSLELVEDICPEPAQEDLATIRHSVMRARELTRQLLTFARKQPVECRTVDLVALVNHAETLLRRLLGPDIQILIDATSEVPVCADPALIEQVLVNLVVNAREAMPSGGKLEIRVGTEVASAREGQATAVAVLSVADSGVGMDDEVRRQVFDPFFTTKSLGTGLGLASSYGIVRQHQGQIEVESKPGKGAVFRVTLPLAHDAAPPNDKRVVEESDPLATGLLMIIDDEDKVREAVARMATSLGYRVVVASNGDEAQQVLKTHAKAIELVVCDVAMPGEDGPAVVERLRQTKPKLSVLFMSGYSPDPRAVCADRSLFIQKPFSRSELADQLAALARQRKFAPQG
jgi:signal transduction histidine kinase/CheY-like chemotaxis protein